MDTFIVWMQPHGKAFPITAETVRRIVTPMSVEILEFSIGGKVIAEINAFFGWAKDSQFRRMSYADAVRK